MIVFIYSKFNIYLTNNTYYLLLPSNDIEIGNNFN